MGKKLTDTYISLTKVSHPSISWVFQPNCFANTHEREPLTHV